MLVLFDIDDTLIDHSAAFLAGARALHAELALPVTLETFIAQWADAHRRHYARYLAGEISHDEQRRARMRDITGAPLSDGEADRAFDAFLHTYESSWVLYPDALPCLQALAHHRLGVISNGESAQQRRKLAQMGIAGAFEAVFVSADMGWAKPDARLFRHACAQVGEPPERAVYIGDHYDLDAAGARQAGLTGIWLDRRGAALASHEPPIITTLDDLPPLVDGAAGPALRS